VNRRATDAPVSSSQIAKSYAFSLPEADLNAATSCSRGQLRTPKDKEEPTRLLFRSTHEFFRH
jgi:hypothetical protein